MKTDRRNFLKQMTAITAAAAIPGVALNAAGKKKAKPQRSRDHQEAC